MTQISDERLAEMAGGWEKQARVYGSAAGAMESDSKYAASCKDTAAALRELQEFRQIQRVLREAANDADRTGNVSASPAPRF